MAQKRPAGRRREFSNGFLVLLPRPSRRPWEGSIYSFLATIITLPDFPAFPTPKVRPVETVLTREFVREGDLQHAPHFGHRQRGQR